MSEVDYWFDTASTTNPVAVVTCPARLATTGEPIVALAFLDDNRDFYRFRAKDGDPAVELRWLSFPASAIEGIISYLQDAALLARGMTAADAAEAGPVNVIPWGRRAPDDDPPAPAAG